MDTIISDTWNGYIDNIPPKLRFGTKIFDDLYLLYNIVSHLIFFKTK
jgi:hypothetical protein